MVRREGMKGNEVSVCVQENSGQQKGDRDLLNVRRRRRRCDRSRGKMSAREKGDTNWENFL